MPVTIRVVPDGAAATLSVEDRGQGMTPDVTERVTERFFRADPSRSRHRGGTGLGLSIVDATVSAHGGAVEIDSEPGSGTTVRLTVPWPPASFDLTRSLASLALSVRSSSLSGFAAPKLWAAGQQAGLSPPARGLPPPPAPPTETYRDTIRDRANE